MATDVAVPALGESITEGTLAQWLKKPGEAVAADEPLASLETDKVTVDVPSPIAGRAERDAGKRGRYGCRWRRDRADRRKSDCGRGCSGAEKEVADATTNPPGAGENPQLRGTEHAPEAADEGEEDHSLTLSPGSSSRGA